MRVTILLVLCILPGLLQAQLPQSQLTYQTDWNRVDSLTAEGLPKPAQALVDKIYTRAKAAQNYSQVAKASMYRLSFYNGAAADYMIRIRSIKNDINDIPDPARSVLQSVLADMYWRYYRENRDKFYQRAIYGRVVRTKPETVAKPTDDLSTDDPGTWDPRRLFTETAAAYNASLQNAALLQKTPISACDIIIERGDADTRMLRPTLYDLLAHRAITYFQNVGTDLLTPIFVFELDRADYLAGPEAFATLALTTRDSLSGRFQALRIYQRLVSQHLSDSNALALADVDNLRLRFVHQYGVMTNKDLLYQQTLERQLARYKGKAAAAEYGYQLSRHLIEQGKHYNPLVSNTHKLDYKQAADIAHDLVNQHPGRLAAQNAAALLKKLSEQTLRIELENATEPNKPFRARVAYQNVATLFYRIYRVPQADFAARFNSISYSDSIPQRAALRTVLSYSLAAQAMTTLPDDGDLQTHSLELPVQGLPPGGYIFLVATDSQFSEKSAVCTLLSFTVSQLSYIIQGNSTSEQRTLYVTDRQTGKPVANVTVALCIERRDQPPTFRLLGPADKTDKSGRIAINFAQLPPNGNYWFRLTKGEDHFDTDPEYNYTPRATPEPLPKLHALFFTDRGIYRPGQTIYVKGLVYSGKDQNFTVAGDQQINVLLRDADGQETNKITFTTNEFGTFSGTFTAPVGRLTGIMHIECAFGTTAIRVEEYKRPTFTVTIDPIRTAVKLGQPVTLTAMAKALSGAVVDGAQVRYQVIRTYYQPYWSYWRKPRPGSPTAQIATGETTTDDKGAVQLSFPATPDPGISVSENPRFAFTITVDVTDQAGETRTTTQTIRIGYSALQPSLPLPAQVKQGDTKIYAVRTTNQLGEVMPIKEGTVLISRLQPPSRLLRGRLWERPDRQLLSREEFVRLFPNDLYENEDELTTWPKQRIKTSDLRTVTIADLASGVYTAEVTVADSTGETARQEIIFTVVAEQPASQQSLSSVDNGQSSWVQGPETPVQPGDDAVFLVGMPQAQIGVSLPMWVLMSVEVDRTIVRQEWLHVDGTSQRIKLPVTEKQRGGFAVNFILIQHGRFYQHNVLVQVPFTNKELTVETQTFRDKLKPGESETWTLTISGPGKDKVLAETVATLYDASLDQFVKSDWKTTIYETHRSWLYTQLPGSFRLSFAQQLFQRFRHVEAPSGTRQREYDQLVTLINGNTSLHVSAVRIGNTVQGRVTDARGQAVPGVTIKLANPWSRETTDKDGRFSIAVAPEYRGLRLEVSLFGYKTQQFEVNKKKRFLRIPEDVQLLNEVVVVGYGTAAERSITGSVATVGGGRAAQKLSMAKESGPEPIESAKSIADKQAASVATRKNFNETAFFQPHLQTDAHGAVKLTFTMPDALTRWKLMVFAHTKDMKVGLLVREIVTQKDLMITANIPRFLREGDTIQVSARINNLTDRSLRGSATATVLNALTGQVVASYGAMAILPVSIAPRLSTAVSWTMAVPKGGPEAITLRLTAQSGSFTDGEEHTIPVLPNRMLVTDIQPFWVNGSGTTSTFKLLPLIKLSPELPVQHERLTVEVTSNPAWYALQSLPYLMEYRYECAEQLFSRIYASSLAAHILNSRPAFRQVVDAWQRSAVLESPLQTNEELKAITLENTPWLADARSETERIARLGQLFNQNQLATQQRLAFEKLNQLQTESGGFRWFGGMEPSLAMTLHILGGLGHLQKLGVRWWADAYQADALTMTEQAIRYADTQLKQWVAQQQGLKTTDRSAYLATHYLYARSFYKNKPLDKSVVTYLATQLSANWTKHSLQGQAMAALALHRLGNKLVPAAILKSLRDRATLSDELGMYWSENRSGLLWYQSPVETQAYLIEAFDEIANDQTTVDNLKRWLLRQKQTQSWSSTKATTEAIYALLLRGSSWLDTEPSLTVTVGGQSIASRVTKTDVATGYQKVVYAASEIKPELGVIQISKPTTGPAWGAAYWQHFDPLDQVKPSMQATGVGLSIQKTLFVQTNSPEGPVINPILPQVQLKPGDLIKVRMILKTDRPMEYVHLKDSRASGLEPVAVLSGYKYQNGLGYYEAPRDASTDFFINYLPVGTHVFEYELRVAQTGDFSAGVATVQCFYAPEFAAHSAGERLRIR